ncbi:hypothetical protein EHV15_22560 [Paenibacillus oralis]|uniref:Uncharacterized protein n=1 Tax=Paenibacillus oralis TaxID=2490856 RepID=A0A3P3U534_9BACL|nr:hypothetical protein EHV15_22560 [Paenibacillus oralis]
MNACFKQLFHGDYCHLHAPPKFGFFVMLPPQVSFPDKTLKREHPWRNPPACVITPSINIP